MSRNQRRNRRNKSGTGQNANRNTNRDHSEDRSTGAVLYRSSTETKSSLKTTELIAYAAAVLGVIMTALAVDADSEGGNDPFGAESAIRYITYLTIGYMIARGLAKSGSHENRVRPDTHLADDDSAPLTHDPATVMDDEDGDQPDGDVEPVDAPAVQSDEVQRTGTAQADARP